MGYLSDIIQPTLLLNEKVCKNNINRMVEKARANNVLLRPHFKTHQSLEIGEWFRSEGISAITVSSIKMATFFAEDGWDDITVAIPANTLEEDRINRLASKIKLNLIIADVDGCRKLASILRHPVGLWIKIDVGYHRTGVLYSDAATIHEILTIISQNEFLTFEGFLTHAGHSYHCRSHQEIKDLHNQSIAIMGALKSDFVAQFPGLKISVGDTPTCSVAEDFSMADEMRPGNFVFYDIMQVQISACDYQDIAVAVACPIVAKHRDRNEILVIGGGVHFSKDFITTNDGNKNFGDLVLLHENGWSGPVQGCFMSKLSQEHGTLQVTDAVFEQLNVGDVVGILPVHSCMTANLLGGFTTLSGNKLDYFDIRKEYFV
jgi:D-serine deaminase-like pyridoxal phosphate-dependent protein